MPAAASAEEVVLVASPGDEDLQGWARRAGITVRSGVDCLIAACAIRHNASVLHRDRDYTALSRISPLRAK